MRKIIKKLKQNTDSINIKSKSGITLISLVITIIVLLILVAITILSLTGDNGLLKLAGESKDRTEDVTQSEKEKIELMGILLDEKNGELEVPADAVARIETTYYTTLQGAIDAVPTDNTRTVVVLLKDVSEYIEISGTKNVALYLNGNTVSPGTSVSNEDGDETIEVRSGATLMVADGKVTATGENGAIGNYVGSTLEISDKAELIGEDPYWGTVYNAGKLNITGGLINGGEDTAIVNDAYEDDDGTIIIGKATISGGEISSNNYGVANYGDLEITEVSINSTKCAIGNDAYESNSGSIIIGEATISGGEITSYDGGVYNYGKLNITGGTFLGEKAHAIRNEISEQESGTIIKGELTISGGNISSNGGYAVGSYSKTIISGGTIGGGRGLCVSNTDELIITGGEINGTGWRS